ncbi:MAG: primosomal protein N', partial [Pseudomonadales bacterium]|nr:primosomal protein N' [Pseudomonadales bacterium]
MILLNSSNLDSVKTNQPILKFAIPSPLRREFDYSAPLDLAAEFCTIGTRFTIPFGKRKLTGLLVGISDQSDVPPEKLRPALAALDTETLLPDSLFNMCLWASQYYQHPIGEVLSNALPVLLRHGAPAKLDRELHYRITTKGELIDLDDLKRAPRQAKALAILREHPQGLTQKALSSLNVTTTHLKGLLHKGLAKQEHLEHKRSWPIGESPLAEPALTLNEEQAAAVNAISQKRDEFTPILLHGITGSGKTEVYLQLIEKALSEDKQVLVLVPEIGLTPQTIQRFQNRFRCAISVLHSGLTDNQRLQSWLKARSGETHIIIGTRSAIFTPMIRPGMIIVDEEHDSSFKQQDGFRYSARDLAVYRGKKENIPVILGTATPCLESLHNANLKRFQYIPLTKRAGGAQPPQFQLLDIRTRKLNNGLSAELIEKIKQTVTRGEQVLLFLNRRGYAPTMICHDCGWMAQCPRCDARYTIHKTPPHLHCHHCGAEQAITPACPQCGSRDLLPLGQGTEKLEEAVRELFPKVPVQRIDRDSTSRKNAMSDIIKQI